MNAFLIGVALVAAAPAPKEAPKADPTHVGDWVIESIAIAGQSGPVPPMTIRFGADGKFERKGPDGQVVIGGTFTVDTKQTPAHIDITTQENQKPGPTAKAIFKIEGDTLTICSDNGGNRPKTFESPAGSTTILMVLKRKKD
jgi:uncharacterized protein (TIGR03067 family)